MLRIDRLSMWDFRAIDYLAVDFHPELTVLIADNGVGKSSILDALSVMVAPFVGAFDDGRSHGFSRSDIRMVQARESYLPEMEYVSDGVNVEVNGHIPTLNDGCEASPSAATWHRFLDTGPASRTTTRNVRDLEAAGAALQACVRRGDSDVILPVVAYYGPGRLYKESKFSKRKIQASSRSVGYIDCLNSASSYKQLADWLRVWYLARREAKDRDNLPAIDELSEYIDSVAHALDICLAPVGWTSLEYDLAWEELIATKRGYGALPVSLLSDGIRGMLSLVADIAFRCTKLNPHLGAEASLRTPGIVLIDEVDLHLHPDWQQEVVSNLRKAFPAVQFILTTHSPQVLTDVPVECIRRLERHPAEPGPGEYRFTASIPLEQTYGADSAQVLNNVIGVNPENDTPPTRDLVALHKLIAAGEGDSREALDLHEKLVDHFGASHVKILEVEAAQRRIQRKRLIEAQLGQ